MFPRVSSLHRGLAAGASAMEIALCSPIRNSTMEHQGIPMGSKEFSIHRSLAAGASIMEVAYCSPISSATKKPQEIQRVPKTFPSIEAWQRARVPWKLFFVRRPQVSHRNSNEFQRVPRIPPSPSIEALQRARAPWKLLIVR